MKMKQEEIFPIGQELDLEWRIINDNENFGLVKDDMRCFRKKTSSTLYTLQNILYGLHNITTPKRLLQALNTAEMLAMYAGIGRDKRKGYHRNYTKTQYEDATVEQLICNIISIGHQNTAINVMTNRGFTLHSAGKNQLKVRMKMLDSKTKQRFYVSYKSPFRPSDSDEPQNDNVWDDPGNKAPPEGRESAEAVIIRNIYIKRIFEMIAANYAEMTKRK